MRWLIGTLVVANLVLLLWWTTERNPALQPAALPQPDVGDLEILGRGGAVGRSATAAAPEAAPPPQSTAPPSPPPAPSPAPEVARTAATVEASSRPAPEERSPMSPSTAPRVAASAPHPKPAPEPPQPPAKPAPKSRVAKACWELGPFTDVIRARSLALPRGVERLKVRSTRIQVPVGYYVLVPAQSSREEARAIVRRLREKGVHDSWLFSSGPLKNAISLGMFSRQENARRRLREIRRLGFPAELQRRHRSMEGYLLQVRGLDTPGIRRLLKEASVGQVRDISCPSP